MSDGKKERSFLATLDLKDGTKLGFSKIASGGSKTEGVEELCANSLLAQSINIRFEPNDEGYYVMFFKGLAPADKVPSMDHDSIKGAGLGIAGNAKESYKSPSKVSPSKEIVSGSVSDDKTQLPQKPITASQPPEQESPIYLAVGASGWVHKTKESGHAYLAQILDCGDSKFSIDCTDAQDVYLKSWRSKNNMQTYKREDFPNKAWFAWMTDCDGTDAVLKLKIIERYNADGSVRP
ncbi:hypothetical protein [Pseudomonas syringae]|uniref:Uncharacterized protein n=3 Tax=Pseudomonas syringae TaxID=317 RepID=A0A656K4P4_PSESF|nr:hypothetical protein [Pseudomonas syringae]EPN69860.1 hypothetical protein A245_01171 [Pseudomonas syringae pv. actinidiae ICMP 19096]EPM43444.1 hypothetical protein A246_26755 [Pseudomonas syringae pv. actinidiae ICMP 19098]EPM70242.1 hypothetical protein A249_38124 [Pseudomonas syringae pv. actinidiae ICMP 18804]EPN14596.1 hypothetical protein A248_26161 [Pseudomonas syringae pv. actinidiae ICMP 19100]EPN23085.1 hypothetical protein A247_26449 [Pseudomonas syringae pv. actinidiae ICMP 190